MKTRPHNKSERGNVIFYILVAVALLAALSFAISESMRGNPNQLNSEKAQLYATEMLEYAEIVSNAVAQLRLRGCEIGDLDLDNDVVAGYDNGTAPSDESCNIFSINGGGVTWRNPEAEWLDAANSAKADYGTLFFPDSTCIINIGTNNGTNTNCDTAGDNEDLLLTYPWIKKEICLEINEAVDVLNTAGDPPMDNNLAWSNTKFRGSMSGGVEIGDGAGTASNLHGKIAGCFEGSSNQAGGYHFYKVLIAQ